MSKNIIFCADGTWNGTDSEDAEFESKDWTNVYKLFLNLDGDLSLESLRSADEQEKTVIQGGVVRQVTKYIHGVGDSRNPIVKLMGGAFGAGVISRVVRGYTFISRNYQPGDKIYITGFSRGAYTARALAGLICSQGVLSPKLTAGLGTDEAKEVAYRRGAQAWFRYRKGSATPATGLARLFEVVSNLPAFLSSDSLKDSDLISVPSLAAVAVWDTVGAMGFPQFDSQKRSVDAFRFADLRLSPKVQHGLHALARDERRSVFGPTLWDAAPNVTQRLFPGAHADVGGGYPKGAESGLSDGALQWMSTELQKLGVLLKAQPDYRPEPEPAGIAHEPWRHAPFNLPGVALARRHFPATIDADPSVAARAACSTVVPEPGVSACKYVA